jgi:hypothetical protein
MDVDDDFVLPRDYRTMACDCRVNPSPPLVLSGCRCTSCNATCRECPGYGFVQAPEKRFHQILTRVRSMIRRRVRIKGSPPGYVRLSNNEIRVLVRKRRAEDSGHWINDYVDLGPPIRVFDVLVVPDRRKR